MGEINLPPSVQISNPKLWIRGMDVDLRANFSDPDGSIVRATWSQIQGPILERVNPESEIPAIETQLQLDTQSITSAPENPFIFKIDVEDNEGAISSAEIAFQIFETPPITAGFPLTVKSGAEVNLHASFDTYYQNIHGSITNNANWYQILGPNVSLTITDQLQAVFTAPQTEDVEKLVFEIPIETNKGFRYSLFKPVFVVPENRWVDAVYLHQALRHSSVIRADGSVVDVHSLTSQRDNSLHFNIESILSFNGWGSVAAVVETDNSIKSWKIGANEGLIPETANPPPIRVAKGVTFASPRFMIFAIDTNGDLYRADDGYDKIYASDVKDITFGSSALFLNEQGDVHRTLSYTVGSAPLASNVKKISADAFLNNDGRIGLVNQTEQVSIFANFSDFIDVAAVVRDGSNCSKETIYGIRQDGTVVASLPQKTPLSPDLKNMKSLHVSCFYNLGLKNDGTVIPWTTELLTDIDQIPILNGDIPSPFNIKN